MRKISLAVLVGVLLLTGCEERGEPLFRAGEMVVTRVGNLEGQIIRGFRAGGAQRYWVRIHQPGATTNTHLLSADGPATFTALSKIVMYEYELVKKGDKTKDE